MGAPIQRTMSTSTRQPVIDETIGFIGSGNMCQALVGGLINKGAAKNSQILCSDKYKTQLRAMEERFDVQTYNGDGGNIEIAKRAKIIVLAIKPPQLKEVLNEIKDYLTEDHLILSVVAGATIDTISKEIDGHKRVSRMMPNTPAMLGAGAGAYSMMDDATA